MAVIMVTALVILLVAVAVMSLDLEFYPERSQAFGEGVASGLGCDGAWTAVVAGTFMVGDAHARFTHDLHCGETAIVTNSVGSQMRRKIVTIVDDRHAYVC